MVDLFKLIDGWFLILMVFLLGGYFCLSVKTALSLGLARWEQTVEELKQLINKLTDRHDYLDKRISDHDRRLAYMEGRFPERRIVGDSEDERFHSTGGV